jgi:hypothetical protein
MEKTYTMHESHKKSKKSYSEKMKRRPFEELIVDGKIILKSI